MSNVVNFKRQSERLNEEAVKHIQEDENKFQIYLSMPADFDSDDPVLFISNFEPGMKELYALDHIKDWMLSQMFPIEEILE